MTTNTDQRTPLLDGSTCVVERLSFNSSMISRHVGLGCVWGQVFSSSDDHDAQVARVVQTMTDDPGAFSRWWLKVPA